MSLPSWHKWFSLFASIVAAIDALLQWLHDWQSE